MSIDGAEAEFVGVVPAAGASRRMGRSKALLSLGDHTFVERVVRSLREGGCARVVVVVRVGDDDLARVAAEAGATVIQNADPGEGPITSLRVALASVSEGVRGIVYLPVDHPQIDASLVRTLLDRATESGAPLTLPIFGEQRGHPAVFARELFSELLDPALEGGARTVVHRHLPDACLVVTEDAGVVTDVDTPSVYEDLRATLESEPAPR